MNCRMKLIHFCNEKNRNKFLNYVTKYNIFYVCIYKPFYGGPCDLNI